MTGSRIGRREYVAATAAAVAAAIAGCSTDSDSPDPRTTTATTTAPTTTAETTESTTTTPERTPIPTERERPFLIVTEDTYPDLRERADREPWATWARRARRMASGSIGTGLYTGVQGRAEAAFETAAGATLSYVLQPDSRDSHARSVLEAVDVYHEVLPDLGGGWGRVVYPSGPFFSLVIALDVVGGSLPDADVAGAEEKLGEIADWYYEHRDGPWPAARYGAYGVWAAYAGQADRLEEATAALLGHFEEDWSDGVYGAGCEYANTRFAGFWGRNTKVHLLDVLEFASGVDVYDRSFVRRDHEWTFGYSLTPIVGAGPQRDCYTFGDSGPGHVGTSNSSAAYRAGRFGDRVENAAAWALVGENPEAARNTPVDLSDSYTPGNRNVFLPYVLTESVPSDPEALPSRIFDGGGAWFHDDPTDAETLSGALWNATTALGHAHYETNALHCCGYGEHLLRNAGYNGWGNGVEEFGWEYVHDRAVANNVVLVDYAFEEDAAPPSGGHAGKAGAGIEEGFVAGDGPVAYASGDSGNALGPATHVRNLVFVPGTDAAAGYWLLFDEVETDAETVHTALHPNSERQPDVDGPAYTVPVGGPYPRSDNDVSLTVAYGTEPESVRIRQGALADWGESYVGRYLYATYPADARTQVATALYPHDGTHAERPSFARLSGAAYSGVQIDHAAGAVDRAVEVDGRATVAGVDVAGRAALVREGPEPFYFVRRGTRLDRGETGFRAETAVSVALRDGVGAITTPVETVVRFDRPGVSGVELEGESVDADAGGGSVEVTVPPGRHALRLV